MSERYLANENFPASIVRELRASGQAVAHVAEDQPGAPDPAVMKRALDEDRVLLTFDRDFGELVFRQSAKPAPGIVLFRVPIQTPALLRGLVREFFSASISTRGVLPVVSPGQVRQIPLPALPSGA